MKKMVFTFIIAAFMLNILSVQAAEPPKKKKDKQENVLNDKKAPTLTESEVQKLVARIDEIDKIDKNLLTPKEKRELRREVRDIKDKINKSSEGIYIGGGVLLVVIILLILLL